MTLIPWVSLGYPALKPARLTPPCAAVPNRVVLLGNKAGPSFNKFRMSGQQVRAILQQVQDERITTPGHPSTSSG